MSSSSTPSTPTPISSRIRPNIALKFAEQSKKLSLGPGKTPEEGENAAIAAHFINSHDAVIETECGERLPAVPAEEAERLNWLRDETVAGSRHSLSSSESSHSRQQEILNENAHEPGPSPFQRQGGSLDTANPPSRTHPLFPPLPLYGPPSRLRNLQCQTFRVVSFFFSMSFLGVVVIGSCFSGLGIGIKKCWERIRGINSDVHRPFYKEEMERKKARRKAALRWKQHNDDVEDDVPATEFPPLEGGYDPVICDIGYYARRVGLDAEKFDVQTEDGFILSLWHIYNPHEYTPLPEAERGFRKPEVFYEQKTKDRPASNRRYPVLLIHGLLQSAGAYCTNDDDSLAFYLCKAGYDVWLGNNRCGFNPKHKTLTYSDPRMWCWNIRHMGTLDLPAFISRILYETGFETVGLICHSQGTTEAMVALAQDQRPELGKHISVFCALAPAAYAGPLIKNMYFRFMRKISPGAFRLFFGIHAFVPIMMAMHKLIPPHIYGYLGYRVFSYLFGWTDTRWDRDLRARMFQFSPVYVSAESMRWWLGCDGFAVQKCILATKEQNQREEEEDLAVERGISGVESGMEDTKDRALNAWYGPKTPPFALWIAGSDDLVDGMRLLRRVRNGREPHVNLVHHKVIEGYEHLDVIWAIDVIEQVGREVAQVVWRTVPDEARKVCRVPKV
ncbi:putative ab-hydrolase associated lipase [Talaromyces proteolyticus]|uniref:Ab-hydrolase associated lipase n=1 Tax=Talaromyces proteolyticus TaxID=1131652 RepID=A0AAD4KHZ0_9EURO|nr:putative ab-hydrolase associated lipase [Talaromyces proteolyticus]KAH8692101.1 putative ab-hydrolase associated lipase [Talaromyces proteolyticus]